MGLIKEFKAFIAKGNVIDLAVAVVIGGAFGKIITSFIEDIITPLLLTPALKAANVDKIENWAPGGIYWGKFLNAVLSFLVIAFVIFLMVKALNKLKKEEAAAPPTAPTTTEKLLMEIRDSLQK